MAGAGNDARGNGGELTASDQPLLTGEHAFCVRRLPVPGVEPEDSKAVLNRGLARDLGGQVFGDLAALRGPVAKGGRIDSA